MLKKPFGLHRARRFDRGFTAIEIIVVMVLAAILVTLAAPSLRDLRNDLQATALGNAFVSDAAFARGSAISRNQCVTVCLAADLSAATPVCATTGADWKVGWIVFANNKCADVASDASAELLKVYLGDSDGPTLAAPAGDALRKIRFNSQGMTSLTAKSSLSLTPRDAEAATKIVCLDRTGRARVAKAGAIACGTDLN